MPEIIRNYGVIEKPPKPEDYIAGIASGVVYAVREPFSGWKSYRPLGEMQRNKYVDAMGCVSWSFNNSVETQINWHMVAKHLTDAQIIKLEPFIDQYGMVNLSDIGLAFLAGTTQRGAWMSRVATKGRNFAIPESAWPFDTEARTWEELYEKKLTDEEIQKYSDIFFSVFEIQTEFVSPTLEEAVTHLKQAPLQIVCPICPGWGNFNGVVQPCGITVSSHAVVIDGIKDVIDIFDHYKPFGKKLSRDYKIGSMLKIVVNVKKPNVKKPMLEVKDNVLYQLVEAPGGFALGLGGKLLIDDLGKILASWLVRNAGKTDGKTATATKKEWDSVPHINLKGEEV